MARWLKLPETDAALHCMGHEITYSSLLSPKESPQKRELVACIAKFASINQLKGKSLLSISGEKKGQCTHHSVERLQFVSVGSLPITAAPQHHKDQLP